jgi:alpha-1,4-digalacturonate transport system substrate-binding protein
MKSRLLAFATLFAMMAGGAAGQDLRFSCYQDGVECDAWAEQLAVFEADNSGITVAVDVVPYQSVLEGLPVQLAVGEGPDLGRVTDFGGLAPYLLDLRPYLRDPEAIEARYGQSLDWARVRGPEDNGVYNIVDQFTATGGFANRTLFEQAGVAMPASRASWEDWAEAATAVRDTMQVDYAMAMDRTGHRFAAPAISYGAKFFDEAGEPILVDEGFRAFAEQFFFWNEEGVFAKEVWAGVGGGTYQDAAAEFTNGNVVFYYSGSWQIGRLARDIGDAFDWVATGPVCGPAACTGIPGGAGIVGFAHTEHPEAVAKVIEFMARDDVQAAVLARTRNIPANSALQEQGVDYPDAPETVTAALRVFADSIAEISPIAFQLQGYKNNRVIYTATPARITQALVGELSLEDALARLDADVAEAAAAGR